MKSEPLGQSMLTLLSLLQIVYQNHCEVMCQPVQYLTIPSTMLTFIF